MKTVTMTVDRFVPMGTNVLIERCAAPKETEGGLEIPDSVRENEKPCVGEIVAIGPDVLSKHPYLKLGVLVWFPAFSGAPMKFAKQPHETDYIILDSDEDLVGWSEYDTAQSS